jgi:hypothetical protein
MSQMNNDHLRVLTAEHRFEFTSSFKGEVDKLRKRGKAGMDKAKRRMAMMEERRKLVIWSEAEEEAET